MKNHIEALYKILNSYSPVDYDGTNMIFNSGVIETFQKDEMVFHENRMNTFEYFQLEGISHRFNLDGNKNQITTGIYFNEVILTPNVSRTSNQLSIFSLQALVESIYLKIPVDAFFTLMESNRSIQAFANITMEKQFSQSLAFEVLFRTSNAKDRLLYFREKYPMLENLIPHSIIASFLGITPVSLSRLRNELTNQ